MILTLLSAVAFAFVFILLAFVIPVKDAPVTFEKRTKPKHAIEEISHGLKNR
ncbi:MAG: hypothetical protein U9Q62_03650 [Campylobacterota bacterium]|nr:hypothetical protein [Campylobacterota bacterium]